jgi:drug/metabolite transporter (DMT)-like permease
MDPDTMFALIPALFGAIGSVLGVIAKLRASTLVPASPTPRMSPGLRVLVGFAFVLICFGALAVLKYWDRILASSDDFMFAGGLFLMMVAGMFVQALAANYRAGRPLFDITATQLIFPLLFAVVVFFPIWTLAANSPRNLFPFYAAFLNGYFWESVVSAAKNPSVHVTSTSSSPTPA